jgi:hypothetical protein
VEFSAGIEGVGDEEEESGANTGHKQWLPTRAASRRLQATSCKPQAASHRLQAIGCKPPAASTDCQHWLRVLEELVKREERSGRTTTL